MKIKKGFNMFVIEDNYEAPQAGVEVIEFEEWFQVEEYLEINPGVEERIREGYAIIKEV